MNRPTTGRLLVGGAIAIVGLVMLLTRFVDFDLRSWWPGFIILPGLLALVAGLAMAPAGGGTAAVVIGSQLTALGTLLLFQTSTGLWQTWAYAWALIWPTSIGLGLMLRGTLAGEPDTVRSGRRATVIGAALFVVGFGFFEGIIGISGDSLGILRDLAWPLILIGAGLLVILRRR